MMQFPKNAPAANPVFFRTYSRRDLNAGQTRESWDDACDRTISGLIKLGQLNAVEAELIGRMQREMKCLPSGRWLWVGGTPWIDNPENFSGAYNCTSTNVTDWRAFGLMMDLAMMGCGTGAVLEPECINQLPTICNELKVEIVGQPGEIPKSDRIETTQCLDVGTHYRIVVGDSRQGWVKAYQELLELSSDTNFPDKDHAIRVKVDLRHVRASGEKLSGFGGTANPVKLANLFPRCAAILNRAIGRKLTAVECCLLIDEAAVVVVAGNVRRSAGMRQFDSNDQDAAAAKDKLWQQGEDGAWRIDPERDALRMANHTRVFHRKPTLEEISDAVRKQFYSGEGAIQWAGEAIARANADLLPTAKAKADFLQAYTEGKGYEWLQTACPNLSMEELEHRLDRYGLNPCGEIVGKNYHCNLSEIHLNQIDPFNFKEQEEAFKAGALAVASLLNHEFVEPRYQYSRLIDPIVGVSFTGLFDFFVTAFGPDWLKWWEAGRPENWNGSTSQENFHRLIDVIPISWAIGYDEASDILGNCDVADFYVWVERCYLKTWRETVEKTVWDYCDRHGLRRPNRCTTVQPAGTKSLLTGASPGWHPPKAQRFIRRITFRKDDPVALACLDYGYKIVPSQSDKDEQGRLLDDPFDPRCTEWLVEIPVEVPWANLPGADQVDISQFSALAQMDFYMQVQKYYTLHNSSSTIELRATEIEPLAERIYQAIQNDEGYISAALLARFDDLQTFPRLPFEPITKEQYDRLSQEVLDRRITEDFQGALARYDSGELVEAGPAGCDSDKCMMPERK